MYRPQKGFVLVSVLIITSISTLLAFHEMSNNRLQERIGGNQQKEINARMNAEQGVIKAYEFIKTQQLNNVAPADIASSISAHVNSDDVSISPPSHTATEITFISKGNSNGAIAQLNATINLIPGQKVLTGIVGCNGLFLNAGTIIDSFDSTKGDYGADLGNGEFNYGGKGDAATIGGNITLGGDSPIYGNVSAGGTFNSSGSSIVMGNVSANGNVTIKASTHDVKDRADVLFEVGSIDSVNGDVNSGANVELIADSTIAGDVNAKGNAINLNDNNVVGNIIGKPETGDSLYQGPNIDTTEKCDNIGLGEQRAGYKSVKVTEIEKLKPDGNFDFTDELSKNYNDAKFTFNEDTAEVLNFDHATDGGSLFTPRDASTNVDFLGESGQNVHVFDDFSLDFQDIIITGSEEVKILVKGDFNVKNTSNIKVEKGSSLSIVVLGKINTSNNTNIIEIGTNDSVAGKSAVSIYSAYNQEGSVAGVLVKGININATINAPFSKVNVKASGAFQGAMRGKEILVDGAGSIHFDEKLSKVKDPIEPSASIAAITYYYD